MLFRSDGAAKLFFSKQSLKLLKLLKTDQEFLNLIIERGDARTDTYSLSDVTLKYINSYKPALTWAKRFGKEKEKVKKWFNTPEKMAEWEAIE